MLNYTKEGISINLFYETRYARKNNQQSVKIVVCFRRVRKYFPTGVSLSQEEWNSLFSTKKRETLSKKKSLESTFYKFKTIIDSLAEKSSFSFETLNRQLGIVTELFIVDHIEKKIDDLMKNDQVGTAGHYRSTLTNLKTIDKRNLEFKHITVEWLRRYESEMLKSGHSYTTIGMYLRNVRCIMNKAIEEGLIDSSIYPFGKGKYEIPIGEGRKLALSLSNIKDIFLFKDELDPTISQYKDLWIFSYLCNGANFNDILRLKYSSINGDELSFMRGKTINTARRKKEIVVYITDEMKTIIKRWGNPPLQDNYIFPYLKGHETAVQMKAIIKEVTRRTNDKMKIISKTLNLPKVTTYTARHSYASVLKRSGANIAFISESLGHSDLRTTENYLAGFETEERKKNAGLLTAF